MPAVLADISELSLALYDPTNNLVYYENNPIWQSTGVNDISIPGYAFMIPTKEQAPYSALVVATFPDGRTRANIELITVS